MGYLNSYGQTFNPRANTLTATCAAFPRGIPAGTWRGSFPHREPRLGDGGLVFTPRDQTSGDYLDALHVLAEQRDRANQGVGPREKQPAEEIDWTEEDEEAARAAWEVIRKNMEAGQLGFSNTEPEPGKLRSKPPSPEDGR